MKKTRKVINQEIEKTIEFTADDIKHLIAKRTGALNAKSFGVTLNPDGSAIAVLRVVRS